MSFFDFKMLMFINALLACGCAPTLPSEGDSDQEPFPTKNHIPVHDEAPVKEPEGKGPPSLTSDGKDINWSHRYEELYHYYHAEFTSPEVDQQVEVRAASGQMAEGILLAHNDEAILLQVGNRDVTLVPDQLHPSSSIEFFPTSYAAFKAREQSLREYRNWKSTRGSENVSPSAEPGRSSPQPTPWDIPPQSDDPMFPINL